MHIAIFLFLGFLAYTILFFTAEFMHYQRGHQTWDFVAKIYNRYHLERIRW